MGLTEHTGHGVPTIINKYEKAVLGLLIEDSEKKFVKALLFKGAFEK